MISSLIQKELEKNFRIKEYPSYKVKNRYYNELLASMPKKDLIYEFPIDFPKSFKSGFKLIPRMIKRATLDNAEDLIETLKGKNDL